MTANVDIQPFSLPLIHPLSTASGTIDERDGFIIRIATDGVVGIGEAAPLDGWTERKETCREELTRVAAMAQHMNPREIRLNQAAPAARHGITLALMDAAAKIETLSLSEYLAGEQADVSVPVHATIGDESIEETVIQAKQAIATGFQTIKVKVGGKSTQVDCERIQLLRDAVGPDVNIRLDANRAWTLDEARHIFTVAAEEAIEYIEEPLATPDSEAIKELSHYDVCIAADESLSMHSGKFAIAEFEHYDVFILKPMILGGIDAAISVAKKAREHHIESVVSNTIDSSIARTAALHLAAALPDTTTAGLATGDRLASDIGEEVTPVTDGRIALPMGAGIGIRPLEEECTDE